MNKWNTYGLKLGAGAEMTQKEVNTEKKFTYMYDEINREAPCHIWEK